MSGFTTVNIVHGGVRVQTEPGGPASGDLTGSYPGPIVAQLQTWPIDPRTPHDGETLVFNGGEWIPTPNPANTATLFKGTWDASTPPSTGTPDIQAVVDGDPNPDGFTWIVLVAGNATLGGITDWLVGDYAIYSGGNWYKLSNKAFGWGLTGNDGTNPDVNYIGTDDPHDLSIRANGSEGFRIFVNGNVQAAHDITVIGNITGSNAKLTGDLAVCGGDITSNAAIFNLLAGVSTALNIGNAAATNTISGQTKFLQGLSGSLTKLTDGTSYLIADNGVLITSASNGAVTLKVDESKFAALTGSTFSGPVTFNAGLTGSLTKLVDGSSYLIAGTNTTVVTNSNGSVTMTAIPSGSDTQVQFNDGGTVFGGTAGFTFSKTTNSITVTGDITGSNERLSGNLALNGGSLTTTATTFNITNTTAATVNIGGGATTGIRIGNSAGINIISGTTVFPQGLSGSHTKLADGTSYITQGQNIAVTTASNGSVNVAFSAGSPTTNDVLLFNGTTWSPSSIVSTLQTSYQTVSASEAIAAGDVCYIVNSGGSSAIPQVARAQANSLATIHGVLGLASGSIAKNAAGVVQTYGQLVGPVDTNTFGQGDPLYVSATTPGGVTNVKPKGPNYTFQIGIVTRQGQPAGGGNSGIVFVSPIMQTDTQNISDIVTTSTIEHDSLVYDTVTSTWKNKQPLWIPETQTALTVSAGGTIGTADFNNVIYLPIKTAGGANVTLSTSTPVANLTKTAADYGRELWLYNADNNRNITIPAGGTVKLDGGVNLVMTPGTVVRLLWTGLGGNGAWIQTSKAVTVA